MYQCNPLSRHKLQVMTWIDLQQNTKNIINADGSINVQWHGQSPEQSLLVEHNMLEKRFYFVWCLNITISHEHPPAGLYPPNGNLGVVWRNMSA